MKKEIKLYALICPITFKIKYIGRTINTLQVRLRGHISKAKCTNSPKNKWILKLKSKNLKPIIKLYKTIYCTWEESHIIERKLIKKCLNNGFDLKNLDDRGQGDCNKIISAEQKVKISNSLKERYKNGLEIKENLRAVCIYDFEGVFIKSFKSIKECSIFINGFETRSLSIEKCLYNPDINKSYKGYQIRYLEDLAPGKYKNLMHKFNLKECFVINQNTKEELKFSSISKLCSYFKTTDNNIRRYFNNNRIYKNKYTIKVPQLKKTLLNGESPMKMDNPVLN